MSCPRWLRFALWCAASTICLAVFDPLPAQGGGGPEGVFVVANSRSWASLTIANHFAALRKVPPSNVFVLDWPYSTDRVDVTVFREKLLLPIFTTIRARGLGSQIDYIIYSSDFPWSIDFKSDLGTQKLPPDRTPVGSLNSLTFFAGHVLRRNYQLLGFDSNFYMRKSSPENHEVESHGFRSWYGFDKDGKLMEGGGASYHLSTMLGITSNHGMSVDEVVKGLHRSAAADGKMPKGTIYFCKTGDKDRSGTREPVFNSAIAELKKLGVKAEAVAGRLPQGKKDVQGLLTGSRIIEWEASQSEIKPGAICENLTSFGGVFGENDQPRLSEFLRNGAAGASGTVIEPFAIHQKFPSAFIQVHYARGCSLAESFYQSVSAPWQLLIVGDPLCRPWAKIPKVSVDGVTDDEELKGVVTITPSATVEGGTVDRFELFVEGSQVARCGAGGSFDLDTKNYPDGAIELRVVAIAAGTIESQGRQIIPVRFRNHDHKIEFTCAAEKKATWKTPCTLTVHAPGAQTIMLFVGARQLKSVNGESVEFEVDPQEFGLGPVTLSARALFSEKPNDAILAPPIELTVVAKPPLPALKLRKGAKTKLVRGLQFLAEGEERHVVPATNDQKWLTDTKVRSEQPFVLAAAFDVPADGVYQFQVKHVGQLSIKIDRQSIYDAKQREPMWNYAPVSLAAGLHQFELRGVGGQPAGLEIRFGGPGATNLDGKQFQHPETAK